jgi:hypothetical protein
MRLVRNRRDWRHPTCCQQEGLSLCSNQRPYRMLLVIAQPALTQCPRLSRQMESVHARFRDHCHRRPHRTQPGDFVVLGWDKLCAARTPRVPEGPLLTLMAVGALRATGARCWCFTTRHAKASFRWAAIVNVGLQVTTVVGFRSGLPASQASPTPACGYSTSRARRRSWSDMSVRAWVSAGKSAGALDVADLETECPALEWFKRIAQLLPAESSSVDHYVVATPIVPPHEPSFDLFAAHDPSLAMAGALEIQVTDRSSKRRPPTGQTASPRRRHGRRPARGDSLPRRPSHLPLPLPQCRPVCVARCTPFGARPHRLRAASPEVAGSGASASRSPARSTRRRSCRIEGPRRRLCDEHHWRDTGCKASAVVGAFSTPHAECVASRATVPRPELIANCGV